jgi:hypothetical protein
MKDEVWTEGRFCFGGWAFGLVANQAPTNKKGLLIESFNGEPKAMPKPIRNNLQPWRRLRLAVKQPYE